MSDKELKKIYGIVLKNSKKKNLIIMILSMVFSLLTIILVIINLIPNGFLVPKLNLRQEVQVRRTNLKILKMGNMKQKLKKVVK